MSCVRCNCSDSNDRCATPTTWSISTTSVSARTFAGAALLAAVRAAANEAGITLFTLDVWTFNTEARAFFARHGFTAYNERLWSR